MLATLARLLHEHAGLKTPAWVIEARVVARVGALELPIEDYVALLSTARGEQELSALVEAVRVGETRFFRHWPQVEALLEFVIPSWARAGNSSPRVWSAGCASGEEPYTLALVLARAMPRPVHNPRIVATDVSAEAIAAARRATYPLSALEHVPAPWREDLLRSGEELRVPPEVAAMVSFEQKNLLTALPSRGFDLIWCRNVLIYFELETRKRVLDKLVGTLKPGGFLFLGYSETLRDVEGLVPVRFRDQTLWEKPLGKAAAAPIRSLPTPAASSSRASDPGPLSGPALSGPMSTSARPSARRSAPRIDPAQSSRVIHLGAASADALATQIASALQTPGVDALTIDLDTADFIDDRAAEVLRRARLSAAESGVSFALRASRPGVQRWLRRHKLCAEDP